jgi:hypothetical protein
MQPRRHQMQPRRHEDTKNPRRIQNYIFIAASRHRGIAASRHRGIAASRHRGIAASRHRGIAASWCSRAGVANALAVVVSPPVELFPLHQRGNPLIRQAPARYNGARARGACVKTGRTLVSCNSDSSHNSRAGHPGWLRCSSLTYSRYARSSRLAIRAPRSGIYATTHCYGTLAEVSRLRQRV